MPSVKISEDLFRRFQELNKGCPLDEEFIESSLNVALDFNEASQDDDSTKQLMALVMTFGALANECIDKSNASKIEYTFAGLKVTVVKEENELD